MLSKICCGLGAVPGGLFYLVDEDFGPLFIKFASYFPYTARVCLNGHEYAKRQLAKEGIAFEALDNGVLSCADPMRLQQILNELDETKIEALVRKWLSRLPDPFTGADHAAGFNPKLSILQAEFSRTRYSTAPCPGATCSRRSSAKTSTWVVPPRSA